MATATVQTSITSPGYWLVKTNSNYAGIVHYSGPANPAAVTGAVYLGTTSADLKNNLLSAVNQLNVRALFEVPGGFPDGLIGQALSTGHALYNESKVGGLAGDPIPGAILASVTGFGLAGLAGIGAAGAAGADTAATDASSGLGTAETAVGSGATGGAVGKVLSKVGSKVGSDVLNQLEKKAIAGGGIAALLLDKKFLFRAVKFIGGLLLGYLGLRQLASAAGANVPSIPLPV